MEEGSPPSYQEVIEGRIEFRTVGLEKPSLETVTDVYDHSYQLSEPQYEPEQRGTNTFTDNE